MAIDLLGIEGTALPSALADLHFDTTVGERRQVKFAAAIGAVQRTDLATGAGFAITRGAPNTVTTLERFWTLPDTVGPAMTLLITGLNPSPAAADDGVGFARPGNRFWPAALETGVVTRDRDPGHALRVHGLGMTDMVKRTTRRADELTAVEYHDGFARLTRLVAWLRPQAVCFVGLAGWRMAVEKKATTGWQSELVAGSPTYVMPSTSGLNASSQLPDFVEHFRILKLGR